MDKVKFETVLQLEVAQILAILCERYKMTITEAREYFFTSKLYTVLKDEETKVWYFSTFQLVELLQEEETGEITSW